jgi:hypothetical protein
MLRAIVFLYGGNWINFLYKKTDVPKANEDRTGGAVDRTGGAVCNVSY